MNINVLDATEHGSITKHRPGSNWLIALACVWMTLPLLAWPLDIDHIEPLSAAPGETVTLRGSGFSEPQESYVVVVLEAPSPSFPSSTKAVELDVDGIQVTDPTTSYAQVSMIVGEAEGPFHGDLFIVEGHEIGIDPVVFTVGEREFFVGGSRFVSTSCQVIGNFDIGNPGGEGGGEPGLPAIQPAATIWAQPMGPSLELLLWLDPIDPIHTVISHMIDPEDCGDDGAKDVILPGQIQMTYLSSQASSQEEFAEDLTIALQYAFADYEGVSVHSTGPWVTVELGREVRGDSILLQVFSTDPPD